MSAQASSVLPNALHSAQSVRALDQYLIEKRGVSASVLMKRAGRFAFDQLVLNWPQARRVVVLCGGGNNAGDGYVVAALAQARQFEVSLRWLTPPEQLKGAAAQASQYARQEGVSMAAFDPLEPLQADVVVDALLGTGLNTEVAGQFAAAIHWINQQSASILALDLPSGISADTGAVLGCAVQAHLTVTFVGLKLGLYTGAGRGCAGRVRFSDLGEDASAAGIEPVAERLNYDALMSALPVRAIDSYKNNFGHVAVVGGDDGFGGAAIIAARAALRAGSGMVSLVSRPLTAQLAISLQPELMALGVNAGVEAQEKLSLASALVVGPGLGQHAWGEQLFAQSLACAVPLCIDADALNLLAKRHDIRVPGAAVITPHPGEAARLLGISTRAVQADRAGAARALQTKTGATVVLKGAGTLVAYSDARGQQLRLVDAGNPGMASGGMGDLLAGIIGALLGQGLGAGDAAQLGALVHSMAADEVAEMDGQRGMLATDLLPVVRALLNGF